MGTFCSELGKARGDSIEGVKAELEDLVATRTGWRVTSGLTGGRWKRPSRRWRGELVARPKPVEAAAALARLRGGSGCGFGRPGAHCGPGTSLRSTTLRAARDDAWRVREMAAKVVARHLLGDLMSNVANLRSDPVARVRVTGAGGRSAHPR